MRMIAIAGVGLIGTSFALALRKAGFTGELVGVSSQRSIEAGLRAGAISRGVSLEEAVEIAEVIYLSQPIEEILRTLEILGSIAPRGCLITDAGSTKAVIVKTAQQHIRSATFLGGHPMAGKEQRGAEAADADLFRGRPYVLTPTEPGQVSPVFRSWLERIGANVIEMEPALHDSTVALTSHLPQVLSTALAATLSRQGNEYMRQVFGPGLLDMTRLSLSAPEVWMSVLATNRGEVNKAIVAFQKTLRELQDSLDKTELVNQFVSAAAFSASIRKI